MTLFLDQLTNLSKYNRTKIERNLRREGIGEQERNLLCVFGVSTKTFTSITKARTVLTELSGLQSSDMPFYRIPIER